MNQPARASISPLSAIARTNNIERYILVYHSIQGIPWREDESGAFPSNPGGIQRYIEEHLQAETKERQGIPYFAPKWSVNGHTFIFEDIPPELFHAIRKYTLFEIVHNEYKSFSTIAGKLYIIRRFFRLFRSRHPNSMVRYMHAEDIIDTLDHSDLRISTQRCILTAMKRFCEFIVLNYAKSHWDVDVQLLNRAMTDLARRDNHQSRGYAAIPEEVYYPLYFVLMGVLRSDREEFDTRITAAITVIYMWTGLRPQEVRLLQRGNIYAKTESGKTIYYLNYYSPKTKRIKSVILFPAALEAVQTAEKLQQSRPDGITTQYLLAFSDSTEHPNENQVYRAYHALLVAKMYDILATPREGMSKAAYRKATIYAPTFYNYRVTLCTYLLDHGFDERWVDAHLGHLSETIRGRYYRQRRWKAKEVQANINAHQPHIRKMVREVSAKLSGNKPVTQISATKLIREIIENN